MPPVWGVSGLDLPAQLDTRRNVPAIALSGYGSEADVIRSRHAGFACHLTKPIDVDDIIRAIDKITASNRN